ncbi:MAG: hypothetical protein GX539_09800, partial [Candidatus Cloacimonetes bacterium]|nr:hypothetical protein [Candidatus Cloacimonadota bacterium]
MRDARARGVSVRRLRHDTLQRPFHGVRMPARDELTTDAESSTAKEAATLSAEIIGLATALATIAPAHWFFSHVTAAVLWGLPLPIRVLRRAVRTVEYRHETHPPLGIDVAAWTPHRAPKGRGVNGHELRPRLVRASTTAGLPVSTPASTWALLGGILSV